MRTELVILCGVVLLGVGCGGGEGEGHVQNTPTPTPTATATPTRAVALLYPGPKFAVGTFPQSVPHSVAVADLNGDGHPDLVTANPNSNDVSVLLGYP